MDFQTYIDSQSPNGYVTADIKERWTTRMVAQGWDKLGREGAEAYLAKHGKNLGANKAIGLARAARHAHCKEIELFFWEVAYEAQFGKPPVKSDPLKSLKDLNPFEATTMVALIQHCSQTLAVITPQDLFQLTKDLYPTQTYEQLIDTLSGVTDAQLKTVHMGVVSLNPTNTYYMTLSRLPKWQSEVLAATKQSLRTFDALPITFQVTLTYAKK